MAAGSAAVAAWTASGQSSLGTLVWVQPDGLWIRELPDGGATKLASGGGLHRPRFSVAGDVVGYRRNNEAAAAVRVDGGPSAAPTPHARLLSPDGSRFAAVQVHHRPPDQYGLNRDKTELYIASAAAPERKLKVLIPENEGAIRLFSWTRDGKSLVYWRADEWSGSLWADGVDLYTIPASGGAEHKLGAQALAHEDCLDLAPSGNLLAVTSGVGRETWTDKRIATIDLDSGAKRDLTSREMAALCPAWSPDSRTIAYTAAPDAGNIGGGQDAHDNLQLRKIWLMDASGASVPRQITNDPHYRDEEPMWSRDGAHILFGRMDDNGHPSLWMMERDGSHPTHICALHIDDPLGPADNWFGFYGYIDWRSAFDWRR